MIRLAALLAGALSLGACASLPGASWFQGESYWTTTDEPPKLAAAQSYADFLIGRVANLREDHRVASDRFFSALETAPRDRYLLEGGVRAALATGDVERAREIAHRRGARRQEIAAASLVRAGDLLLDQKWADARALIERMHGEVGEEFAGRVIGAWAKVGAGAPQEAVTDFTSLTAPRPFASVFLFQQAMAFDVGGRADDARAAYLRAETEGAWFAPGVMRHADFLVRAGARDEALALLQRTARDAANPEIEDAQRRLAAGERLRLQPLTPARGAALGLYGLGALLSEDSNTDDGLVMLSLARQLDPGLEAAQVSFADAQRGMKHYADARATLAALPPDSPYLDSARLMTAWLLRDEGHVDEALTAARAAADASTSPRTQIAYGDLLRAADRYADADAVYTRLIGDSANDWRLYFARADAREHLHRWPDAEADLQRALALAPEQPEVMNYLGYSWVDRGEHLSEGLAMLQRAAALRPNSGAVLDSLGWAFFRLHRYDQALPTLERAVELEPADPLLNDHLGDLYWRLDRRLEARFQWSRVLTLNPDADVRAAVQRKIEAGLPAPSPLAAR